MWKGLIHVFRLWQKSMGLPSNTESEKGGMNQYFLCHPRKKRGVYWSKRNVIHTIEDLQKPFSENALIAGNDFSDIPKLGLKRSLAGYDLNIMYAFYLPVNVKP